MSLRSRFSGHKDTSLDTMTKPSTRILSLLRFFATVILISACSESYLSPDATGSTDGGVDLPRAPDLQTDSTDSGGCVDNLAWTVGLRRCGPRAAEGYTVLAPMRSNSTYLIDRQGRLVHSWPGTYNPGMSAYLLPDGALLRPVWDDQVPWAGGGGGGGRIQLSSWEGKLLWDYPYATSRTLQHHDVTWLPGGTVLLVAWERMTADEAQAAGRDPGLLTDGELWVDYLVEVRPDGFSSGTVIWEWHLWDHLIQNRAPSKANYGIVSDHPELLDINFARTSKADWTHVNSVAYNAQLDQIVISVHGIGEIFVIDHSTTTAEAAGHSGGKQGRGGDLLYRWGNPVAYGAGSEAQRVLFGQHDAQWIAPELPGAGGLLVFNNGGGRPGATLYSSVDQLSPPVDPGGSYALSLGQAYGPAALTWSYSGGSPQTSFFSRSVSGAQRLAGGNTLVCVGQGGVLFEVTADRQVVWEYVNPISASGPLPQGASAKGVRNNVFKARRYGPSFTGLKGRDLSPKGGLELTP
jgi:hypothetical protein